MGSNFSAFVATLVEVVRATSNFAVDMLAVIDTQCVCVCANLSYFCLFFFLKAFVFIFSYVLLKAVLCVRP